LFRLHQLEQVLRSGPTSFISRAQKASERFDVPVEVIKKLLPVDPYKNPNSTSSTLLKRLARELTEQEFEYLDYRTIRNQISLTPYH
jgi:hypothetical protein